MNNQLARIQLRCAESLKFANACVALINEAEIPVFTAAILCDWLKFDGFVFGQTYHFLRAILVPSIGIENPEAEPFQQRLFHWGIFQGWLQIEGEDVMFFTNDNQYFAFRFIGDSVQ